LLGAGVGWAMVVDELLFWPTASDVELIDICGIAANKKSNSEN
jgi:hypothetical protein